MKKILAIVLVVIGVIILSKNGGKGEEEKFYFDEIDGTFWVNMDRDTRIFFLTGLVHGQLIGWLDGLSDAKKTTCPNLTVPKNPTTISLNFKLWMTKLDIYYRDPKKLGHSLLAAIRAVR